PPQTRRDLVMQPPISHQPALLGPPGQPLGTLGRRMHPVTVPAAVPSDLPRDHRPIPTQPSRDQRRRHTLPYSPQDLVPLYHRQRPTPHPTLPSADHQDHLIDGALTG